MELSQVGSPLEKSSSQCSIEGSIPYCPEPPISIWRIAEWSQMNGEISSPVFLFEGLNFQMKLTKPSTASQFISAKIVLLDTPPNPKIFSFQVVLINKDSAKNVSKRASKAFSKKNAYDTVTFIQNKVCTQEEGFVIDGALTFNVLSPSPTMKKSPSNLIMKVSASSSQLLSSPHYVPLAESYTPNLTLPESAMVISQSQIFTGYVGIKNQGATCYMNSLLQSLFHIPAFRRIVYNMPTNGSEIVQTSIPLNLQRLFCQLQLGKTYVSTTELTKSFGWKSNDTMQQQDVQEFCRVLMENLESKLKNTDLGGSIGKLFKGRSRTVFKCKNVDLISQIDQDFMDISLVVSQCKNIYESLDLEIQKQTLDGNNQYCTEQYGKQDAEMWTEFIELPSILHLHLRRFERDPIRDRCIKINDYFEYFPTLNMEKYIAKDGNQKGCIYDLYGVLVHSGGSMCGHYYAFLRTSTEPQWYRFDDQKVSLATDEEAINGNFGGKDSSGDKCFSGYMLIYVRREDAPAIFESIPNSSIPQHLIDYFNNMSNYSKSQDQGPIEIRVTTESTLRANSLKWAFGFDSPTSSIIVSLPREKTYDYMYQHIAKLTIKDPPRIRIWKCGTYSTPHDPLMPSDNPIGTSLHSGVLLFVQDLHNEESQELPKNNIVVFLKFFFPGDNAAFYYIGSAQIESSNKVSCLVSIVNLKLGTPEFTPLLIFQETVQKTAQQIRVSDTFTEASIGTGTILIFQIPPDHKGPLPNLEKLSKKTSSMTRIPSFHENSTLPIVSYVDVYPEKKPQTADQYIEHKTAAICVNICNVTTPSQPIAALLFPSNLKWPSLKQFIGAVAKIDYKPESDSMFLFKRDPTTQAPQKSPINYRISPSLKIVFSNMNSNEVNNGNQWLYYQLLSGIPEGSNNSMTNYSVQFSSDGISISSCAKLLLPNRSSVRDIANEMQHRGLIPSINHLRAVRVQYHRVIESLCFDSVPISDASIRFEFIRNEFDIDSTTPFVCVLRGYLDKFQIPRLWTEPILFDTIPSETIKGIRDRLLQFLQISETGNELASIVVLSNEKKLVSIDENDEVDNAMGKGTLLLLEPKPSKSKSSSPLANPPKRAIESALKIHN